ncbi:cation:proton antiporter subunit C [bacterium AH-315-J23]|nr:cation:proton antiporter subunit C [bacterium AH-315-J23]PHQ67175.1 MAG: NADH:quinone oxidoreductase [Robiginitomaculum sp.]
MSELFEHFNFAVVIVLMMVGLYVVFASNNMIKKLVGLSVFQTSVFLLYISMGKVSGGQPPIIAEEDLHGVSSASSASSAASGGHDAVVDGAHQAADVIYSNPLPHVLILTAIVVGVATLAIGLALVVRIREAYGTIEEDEIDALDYAINSEGAAE